MNLCESMLMYGGAGIDRQADLTSLRHEVESELGRGAFSLGLRGKLSERYLESTADARSKELTTICEIASIFYLVAIVLTNLFATSRPDWPSAAIQCTITPFVALSIAYVAFRPEKSALIREGGACAAACCFSLATLLAVCTAPRQATVLCVVVALFFVHLRFAAAAVFVVVTAFALWLALPLQGDVPSVFRFYPLHVLLAVSGPALLSVYRLERAARDRYLNGLLQDVRIEQLALENNLLTQLSATDALTGAANRRQLEGALRTLCAEPPSGDFLLLADIDYFKRFNDRHGHVAGDACLRDVVSAIRRHLRRGDLVARFGGEEFAIILPHTTRAAALVTAERIRAGVANHSVIVNGQCEQVTVSIGIAERARGMAPVALLALADDALYAAKNDGRNKVRCALQAAQDVAA